MAPILASNKTSSDYIAYENIIPISPGYEIPIASSLATVGQLGAENNCYISHYYIVSYYHITLSYQRQASTK